MLDNFQGVEEEVQVRVTSWLKGAPSLFIQTDEDTASEDDQGAPTCRKQTLKSGTLCTSDTVVTKRITWPHKVVYSSQGQPTIYDEISAMLFVNGYLTISWEDETDVVKGTFFSTFRN